MKEVFWVGSALADLRAFPGDARDVAGYQLWLLQQGDEPHNWKPMASVGHGVYELRIHTAVEHRVFYVAKFSEGIYVLHAFQKKAQRTAPQDIELGRKRYQTVLKLRREAARPRR